MARTRSYALGRAHSWNRGAVQFGGGLFFGGILPFLIGGAIMPGLFGMSVFGHSLLASLAAIATGYYLFRSLTKFPGIQAGNYILPIFSSAFAAAVTGLFLLRLDYSRPLLIASYVLCLGWYYLVYFRQQRQRLHIGVVPFGDVESLGDIRNVAWERIEEPGAPLPRGRAIVADFRADMPDAWERYLADAALNGVTVFHVKQLRESLTGKVQIEHLSENAYGSLVPQAAYMVPKSVLDVIVAATALLLLLPFLLVIALIVRLTSPGPVFFRQQRIGYRGVPFSLWKFRTMTHRVETDAHPDQARLNAITLDNDVRITRVGRILRRTRIDELPQLVNVCAGQMSFIGPRPEADVLSRWYQQEIPFYRYRHIVRPGITGWAQVNQGHVADVAAVHSKLHYDFYYISNFSLWIDVLILMRTVRTILTGFGSK